MAHEGILRPAQVMYRERAAGMYDELPFAVAQCLIEIPYNLAQSLLFAVISYWMLGFENSGGATSYDSLSLRTKWISWHGASHCLIHLVFVSNVSASIQARYRLSWVFDVFGCLRAGKFFWFVFIIFLTLNLMCFYGVMGVYITPDLIAGAVLSGFFHGFWCFPRLPRHSRVPSPPCAAAYCEGVPCFACSAGVRGEAH